MAIKIKKIINILLLLAVLFPYTDYKFIGYLSFLLLFYIICIFLFNTKKIRFEKHFLMLPILFIIVILCLGLAELFGINRNFNNSIFDFLQRIFIFLILAIIFSNINKNDLISTFLKLIKNTFIVGLICLFIKLFFDVNLINENAIAFFILPYLGYICITSIIIWKKILYFILGCILLYLSNGRASLLAFFLTPILIITIKRPAFKILFFTFISIGSICCLFYLGDSLMEFDELLSGRSDLQLAYINEILKKEFSLLFGSGEFTIMNNPNVLLGTHQTWLGLIWMYGILGFIVNFFIIIYYLRVKVENKTIYLHVITFYILIVQLFEVINLGGISYLSLVLITSLMIPLKTEEKVNY